MTGQSVDSLWHTDRGIYDNLIFRKQLKEVKEDLKNNCRVIYVHANLGNGKTIFAECLKHLFEDEGYQIFTLKTVYMKSLPTDVQHIVESPGKKLVIIEDSGSK